MDKSEKITQFGKVGTTIMKETILKETEAIKTDHKNFKIG